MTSGDQSWQNPGTRMVCNGCGAYMYVSTGSMILLMVSLMFWTILVTPFLNDQYGEFGFFGVMIGAVIFTIFWWSKLAKLDRF
jgi:hypothetical protein